MSTGSGTRLIRGNAAGGQNRGGPESEAGQAPNPDSGPMAGLSAGAMAEWVRARAWGA
jgi:hypothetical protein